MELHDENPFKIRSYANAYLTLRKIDRPLSEIPIDELVSIKGVGKNISDKIQELLSTGELQTYNKYASRTPDGIVQMLDIKGFGPKKIKIIWNQLGIENIGELLYACNENRLVELKGFGLKTQLSLKNQLEYFIASQGKYHHATVEKDAHDLEDIMMEEFPDDKHALIGDVKRLMPEVNGIDILTTVEESEIISVVPDIEYEDDGSITFRSFPLIFHVVAPEEFGKYEFENNSSEAFLEGIEEVPDGYTEDDVFEALDMAYVYPEYRESETAFDQSVNHEIPALITDKDIKGVVHNHSTYSDGIHSVSQMAQACIDLGYEYLVMSDHSKAAFYANGLTEDQVFAQMEEIDRINVTLKDFRIFKSIECDILNDGSMDYGDEFLKEFELVIASVHTNLKMDEKKANARLVKAIENPNTHILGHPTGRLLLAREGYPIDHALIIDACAANGMIIELNANPSRLDLDWSWIPYALEKEVKISINPDAHSMDQIKYIHAGVNAARKGGLTKEMCLNTLSLNDFTKWVDGL